MEGLLFERYLKKKFSKMKGEDLQKLVLSKYVKGEPSTKIFEDFNGFVSSRTIRQWCKMVRETGTINLSHSGSFTHYQDQRNDPKGEKTNEI